MNKEEHLWAMFGSQEFATKDLRLWLCEALAERDAAREELAKLKAAQPEPAPVVGGVTEEMLDEIQHLVDQYPYCPGVDEKASVWLKEARAAIRAQKRVDVEVIREVARDIGAMSYASMAKELLRAIGDEPAAPDLDGWPFTRQGCYFRRAGKDWLRIVDGSSAYRADEALALLNAGLEAPKLRARVAELERSVDFHQSAAKEIAAERDAAEAKLAALGENPIRRELVERWRDCESRNTKEDAWSVLVQILAGREPGVAS